MKIVNRYGFTLIELLVAAGAMGIVVLGSSTLLDSLQKSSKIFGSKSEQVSLAAVMQTHMSIKNSCTYTLIGRCSLNVGIHDTYLTPQLCATAGGVWTAIPDTANLTTIYDNRGNTLLTTNHPYVATASVGSLFLKTMTATVVSPTISWPAPNTTGLVAIKMTWGDKPTIGTGNEWVRLFPLVVKVDGSSKISECFVNSESIASSGRQKSCEDIGGHWNSTNNYCQLLDQSLTVNTASTGIDDYLVSQQYVERVRCLGLGMKWDTTNLKCLATLTVPTDNSYLVNSILTALDGTPLAAGDTLNFATTNYIYTATTIKVAQTCPVGTVVLGRKIDGTLSCSTVCPSGQVSILTPTGPTCIDAKQSYLYFSNGSITATTDTNIAAKVATFGGGLPIWSNFTNGCLTSTVTTPTPTNPALIKTLRIDGTGLLGCDTVFQADGLTNSCTADAPVMNGIKYDASNNIVPNCCMPAYLKPPLPPLPDISSISSLLPTPDKYSCDVSAAAKLCPGQTYSCLDDPKTDNCGSITGTGEHLTFVFNYQLPDQVTASQTPLCNAALGYSVACSRADTQATASDLNCNDAARFCATKVYRKVVDTFGYQLCYIDKASRQTACTGTSPYGIYSGVHCNQECIDHGGTIEFDPTHATSNSYCKFTGVDNCPTNWTTAFWVYPSIDNFTPPNDVRFPHNGSCSWSLPDNCKLGVISYTCTQYYGGSFGGCSGCSCSGGSCNASSTYASCTSTNTLSTSGGGSHICSVAAVPEVPCTPTTHSGRCYDGGEPHDCSYTTCDGGSPGSPGCSSSCSSPTCYTGVSCAVNQVGDCNPLAITQNNAVSIVGAIVSKAASDTGTPTSAQVRYENWDCNGSGKTASRWYYTGCIGVSGQTASYSHDYNPQATYLVSTASVAGGAVYCY